MWTFLSALFLWLTMITMSLSEPIDLINDNFHFDRRVLSDNSQDLSRSLNLKPNVSHNEVVRTPPTLVPNTRIDPRAHPNRGSFYTPALPKNHISNIFADQPTLRGSNAANPVRNRRPQILDETPATNSISIEDTKKKAINTPSVEKLPDGLNYSDPSTSIISTTSSSRFLNNTLDLVGAAVPNLSQSNILRILHDNNYKSPFFEVSNSKPLFETNFNTQKRQQSSHTTVATPALSQLPVPSPSPLSVPAPAHSREEPKDPGPLLNSSSTRVDVDSSISYESRTEKEQLNTEKISVPELSKVNLRPEVRTEGRIKTILGSAWYIHVYSIAFLFAILIGCSAYSLARTKSRKWMLPCRYFISIHTSLLIIGCLRCFYLMYDAYNLRKSFAQPLNRLLYDIAFPLLICVFSLMFLFLMNAVPLKMHFYCIFKGGVFVAVVLVYLALSLGIDPIADSIPYSSTLVLVSQYIFVLMCLGLGVTYILFYKYVTTVRLHHPNPVQIYTSTCADLVSSTVANAVRLMLAVSLLSLLMAGVQVIGIFCVADPLSTVQQHPWLWWASQLSIRVIEVSICFLVLWAAVQSSEESADKELTYGGPRHPWTDTLRTPGSGSMNYMDTAMYPVPTVNTGRPFRSYTLQSNKDVYEDVFQYYDTSSQSVTHIPAHLSSGNVDAQMLRRNLIDVDGMKMLPKHPPEYIQSSPSMLVDDRGVIRFKSITDEEIETVVPERIGSQRSAQYFSS